MSRLDKKNGENVKLNKINSEPKVSGKSSFHSFDDKYDPKNVAEEREQMYNALQSLSSILDSSGEYQILAFISIANALKNSRLTKHSSLIIGPKIGESLDGGNHNLNLYRRNDIAIVTHTTISQLYHVPLLAKRWHGLISIALFVTTIQQLPLAIEAILLLRNCNPSVRHRVSFHLVYPLSLAGKLVDQKTRIEHDYNLRWSDIVKTYPDLYQMVRKVNCGSSRLRSVIEKWDAHFAETITRNYAHQVPYPNNLLRNIARRYALTEYSLVIDVDLVPSALLYEKFIEFGKRTKLFKQWDEELVESNLSSKNALKKLVFVLPTYEIDLNRSATLRQRHRSDINIDEDELIPGDKSDLILGIEQQTIRPFYIELCWKCQKYTDYEAWLHSSTLINSTEHETRIDILFEILWHDPWEPFYISSNDVPLYDERFRQYGFNRISQVNFPFPFYFYHFKFVNFQVCELHMAGYRFAILNNAFLVHKGFKVQGVFHSNKDLELEHNRMLFRQFKIQLKDRYPTSNRRC